MKIIVTGYGTTGDTQPLIALAAGLKHAGHQVVLVTDEAAVESATRLGLDCRVLAGSARSMLTAGSHGWAESMKSGRPTMQLLVQVARFNTLAWIETIDQAAEGADVIVATTLVAYHAASVAQERGIRLVFGQLQPSLVTGDYPPPLLGLHIPSWLNRPLAQFFTAAGNLLYRGAVNKARRELGQPGLSLVWEEVPVLAAWSPTLVPPSKDWTHPDVTITGPWLPPVDTAWQPSDDLADFLAAGEPPIYVGFGSMAGTSDAVRLREAILEGLSDRRVVLSAGWADLTDTRLPDTRLPDNVFPIDWAPHDWLFPRCAAVMHHCGAGTTHQAARAGVPSIPVPFLGDQLFWADRLDRLGIATGPLNPRRITTIAVREAAQRADAAELRTKAHEVAAQLGREPDGVSVAIHRIEGLAD